ncbi:MAG: heme exporter protein CcmB [Pseudomonadales bacterium]
MSGAGSVFLAQFRREALASLRSLQEAVNPLVFLFLAITLFALGVGVEAEVLGRMAPGIIWVLVLLANLLALDGLFRRDYDDGTLEQMLLLGRPPFLAVLAKVAVQWCLTGLAMTLLAPVAALLLFLPPRALGTTMLTLLVGSPALTLLGAVGAALTVGLRRGGVLLALLVLPLAVPTLIFGAGAVTLAMSGIDASAQIYWLMAISMLSLTMAPFAIQAALHISLEQS